MKIFPLPPVYVFCLPGSPLRCSHSSSDLLFENYIPSLLPISDSFLPPLSIPPSSLRSHTPSHLEMSSSGISTCQPEKITVTLPVQVEQRGHCCHYDKGKEGEGKFSALNPRQIEKIHLVHELLQLPRVNLCPCTEVKG